MTITRAPGNCQTIEEGYGPHNPAGRDRDQIVCECCDPCVLVLGLIFNGAVSSPSERQYYQPCQCAAHWEPEEIRRATGLAGKAVSTAE